MQGSPYRFLSDKGIPRLEKQFSDWSCRLKPGRRNNPHAFHTVVSFALLHIALRASQIRQPSDSIDLSVRRRDLEPRQTSVTRRPDLVDRDALHGLRALRRKPANNDLETRATSSALVFLCLESPGRGVRVPSTHTHTHTYRVAVIPHIQDLKGNIRLAGLGGHERHLRRKRQVAKLKC